MSLSASEINEKKKAPAVEGVLPVFHERWSPRFFSDREVKPETLAKLFEAARWAASSSNAQPWRYVLGYRGSETHGKIVESLTGSNPKWAGKAPVLMSCCAYTKFPSGQPNRFAFHDLGAATSYLTLEAAAIGLATHQMAGFDQDKLRGLLAIPEDYVMGSVVAIGYQGDPVGSPNDDLVKRELAPRERNPLSAFVFSSWGEPAKLG